MTKQEILDALESLKDMVNHVGKQSIDSIKAGISMNLLERQDAIVPCEPVEDPEPYVPEVTVTKKEKPKIVSRGTKKKK